MTKNINLADLKPFQGFSIYGASAGDSSGYSVSSAGDVNGDGIADIIIGARNANNKAGISYVLFGATGDFDNVNLTSLTNKQGFYIYHTTSSQSGHSVSGAGDVNNDGYADIIIGAPDIYSYTGVSYVIYGSANPSNVDLSILSLDLGIYIRGAQTNDYCGSSVSGAGDVNNDGYADIIIGAYGANSKTVYAPGVSYVIYGGPKLNNINLTSLALTQGFLISGTNSVDESGWSVSRAGDFNGDQYDDVIVGAHGVNSTGAAYILYGGSNVTNIDLAAFSKAQGVAISGFNKGTQTGCSVSAVGDINQDGYADVIIGALATNSNAGASYVVYGGANLANINLGALDISQGISIVGVNNSGLSGSSVSGAGDVNKDGYLDIIVGAPGSSTNGNGASVGTTYIIYGGVSLENINLSALTTSQGFSITGSFIGDNSGFSISNAGDFNDDGIVDIIIGAPNAKANNASGAGISYLIFGTKDEPANIIKQSNDILADDHLNLRGTYELDGFVE